MIIIIIIDEAAPTPRARYEVPAGLLSMWPDSRSILTASELAAKVGDHLKKEI